MTIFLFSLAGIPPAAGWFAKFGIFQALASAGTTSGYVLAVVVGVNSVIAFAYYGRLLRIMWMEDAPDGDVTPIRVPGVAHRRPGHHRRRHPRGRHRARCRHPLHRPDHACSALGN